MTPQEAFPLIALAVTTLFTGAWITIGVGFVLQWRKAGRPPLWVSLLILLVAIPVAIPILILIYSVAFLASLPLFLLPKPYREGRVGLVVWLLYAMLASALIYWLRTSVTESLLAALAILLWGRSHNSRRGSCKEYYVEVRSPTGEL
jgi:hypothetical protein